MRSRIKKIFSRLWKKKWWVLPILAVLIIGGIRAKKKYFTKSENEPFVSNDYIVATGTVSNSLSLGGTTQFANAQKLTFVNKGRVTSVKTKIGAHVKKGDVLATITTDDLDREVESVKKSLKNKQLDLKKILDKSNKELDLLKAQSEYDLLLIQKQLLPGEQELDRQTKNSDIQDSERLIKDKEKELSEAQTDYAELLSGKAGATHAELSLSETVRKRNNDMRDMVNGFRIKANEIQAIIDDYDSLVKLTDVYNPNDQDIYLGAKDLSAMQQSKDKFWQIKEYIQKFNTLYQKFSDIPLGQLTEDQILSGYSLLKPLGTEMKEWGKINRIAFGETIETVDRTREKIVGLTKSYGTDYEDKGFSFINDYTLIVERLASLKKTDTTIEDSADKVEKIRIELERLKIDLNKKKLDREVAKKQQVLATAELDKKIQDAKLELEKARDGNSQQEEIDAIQNDIDNLQFNLTTLMKKYDEYKIIANFEGIVTKMDLQVGDSVGSNQSSSEEAKYIYVETPDLLEIKLDVDQVDIVKIQMGMPVEVYIDAFPESTYSGVFSEIDTMPDSGGEFGGGGSYKAKVVFKKNNPEEKILGGMSANVKVMLSEVKDAIVVPNPAIVDNDMGEKIVRLQQGDTWVDRVVEVGMADEVNTVITTGLNIGDVIKGLYITDDAIEKAGLNREDDGVYMGY